MTTDDPEDMEAARLALLARLAPLRERLHPESSEPWGGLEGSDDRFARLVRHLQLTDFEASWLLLCIGVRVAPEIAADVIARTGQATPTFALASQLFAQPHLSALHPHRPLIDTAIVNVGAEAPLGECAFGVNDRVLHHLLGMDRIDPSLEPVLELVEPPPWRFPSWIDAAHTVAKDLIDTWDTAEVDRVIIEGPPARARSFAVLVARALRLDLYRMAPDVASWPASDRAHFRRLWRRELLLDAAALWVEGPIADLSRLPGLVFLSTEAQGSTTLPRMLRVRVPEPAFSEVLDGWVAELALDETQRGAVAEVLFDIRLSPDQWHAAMVQSWGMRRREPQVGVETLVLRACIDQQTAVLATQAERLEARAQWADLVLPQGCVTQLRAIVHQARHRYRVLQTWGFDRTSSRGLAITALFHGPSGTGKTMAAEVIANALERPLFRIDLSRVVSKYIGETEKNLRAIFDAANGTGVILLFDEADALFGKRSEVKDSHDRYANQEVSFLLQEMERYRGLALLTTNRKDDLDDAFRRRLRFILGFPSPGVEARRRMWSQVFPPDVPLEDLDVPALATHALTGGDIRNAALAAAYAAADGGSVRPEHIERAVRAELVKSGRG
ncbi:MAG: ATP-binding protein [Myxococcota bacterium]